MLVKEVQSSEKKAEAREGALQRTSAPQAEGKMKAGWQCSILNPELRWGVLKPHFKVQAALNTKQQPDGDELDPLVWLHQMRKVETAALKQSKTAAIVQLESQTEAKVPTISQVCLLQILGVFPRVF